MLPYLIYGCTFAYVPHAAFMLAIGYSVIKKDKFRIKDFTNPQFLILLLIIVLSTCNFIIHAPFAQEKDEVIPYTILMLGSYLIAVRLSSQELRILIYLAVVECLFAYAEFVLGVKTFFTGLEDNVQNRDLSLLYYRSVFGLSDNSSSFAVKVLLAYLLIYFLELAGKRIAILKIILLGGLVISFNRTTMLAVVLFHGIRFLLLFRKSFIQFLKLKMSKTVANALLIGVLVLVVSTFAVITNYDLIVEQLTRRTSGIEITGRDRIWTQYLEFISNHLLTGNGSQKYFLYQQGGIYHAHNSFLQVFANHGIIIGSLFILLIGVSINRHNFIYMFPIVVYSLFQYGIFWGISMLDIVFFLFLLNKGSLMLPDKEKLSC